MARRRFHLTTEQVKELTKAYGSCKDGPTRTRYQVVRLYGIGYPVEEVMDITGCSRTSLMQWCRAYCNEGSPALVDQRLGGNRAKLTPAQIADLKGRLHLYTPADLFGQTAATTEGQFWTVADLQRAIQQWYGVNYQSRSSYHRFLDLCGFSYQRPAKVYKSRSEAQVAEFEAKLEKNWLTLPKTVIMSPYLQATTTAVWAPRGQTPVVLVHPGREKVNFYGALNLNNGQEIVMRATVMNAATTVRHLERILQAVPEGPILLLWDRAPWHFGQPIREVLAANPRLEVHYFPVAAPELNPQEHGWKAARR
jgi:transposase